jgi:2,4-dienoyl-CoA reductase-like NADH-dependent reductase (Old Yellow Enzyme family)
MQVLTKFALGDLVLKNRIVLAPLTRARYVSDLHRTVLADSQLSATSMNHETLTFFILFSC